MNKRIESIIDWMEDEEWPDTPFNIIIFPFRALLYTLAVLLMIFYVIVLPAMIVAIPVGFLLNYLSK